MPSNHILLRLRLRPHRDGDPAPSSQADDFSSNAVMPPKKTGTHFPHRRRRLEQVHSESDSDNNSNHSNADDDHHHTDNDENNSDESHYINKKNKTISNTSNDDDDDDAPDEGRRQSKRPRRAAAVIAAAAASALASGSTELVTTMTGVRTAPQQQQRHHPTPISSGGASSNVHINDLANEYALDESSASTKDSVHSKPDYKLFLNLVDDMYNDEDAEEFRQPVLEKYRATEVPDYKTLVKNPMDLGTIRDRLTSSHYYIMQRPRPSDSSIPISYCLNETKLLADIRLVFENCKLYNDTDSYLYATASKFLKELAKSLRVRKRRFRDRARKNLGQQTSTTNITKAIVTSNNKETNSKNNDMKSNVNDTDFQSNNSAKVEMMIDSLDPYKAPANMTSVALEQAAQEAENIKRRHDEDLRRKDEEWQARLEAEKQAAAAAAVQRVLQQQNQQIMVHRQQQMQLNNLATAQHVYQQQQQQTLQNRHQQQIQHQHQVLQQQQQQQQQRQTPPRRHSRRSSSRHVMNDDDEGYSDEDIDDGDGDDHNAKNRRGKVVNTSSISSDEQDGRNAAGVMNGVPGSNNNGAMSLGGLAAQGDVTFVFVSTEGMEKKRGRKSARVAELESEHDILVKQRKAMVDATLELDKLKQLEMTINEKRALCEQVATLDYIRMKGVVDLLARGLNRPDLLAEVEIDLDIDVVDSVVLREIQFFLRNPVAMTAKDALRQVETDIADIESQLVELRYQKSEV